MRIGVDSPPDTWLRLMVYKADMRRGDAYVVDMFKKTLRRHGWDG